jgi:flagellar hook-length control protein FliK
MGAGSAVLAMQSPLPAVGEVRTGASDPGQQPGAGNAGSFAAVMDSTRDASASSAQGGTAPAAPAPQAAPAPLDTAARGPAAADSTARSGAQADTAPKGAEQDHPAPGAATPAPPPAPAHAAPGAGNNQTDAIAALLPALEAGTATGGAPGASDGALASAAAPPAKDGTAKSDCSGATVTDPMGLLAMMFGAVPPASGGGSGAVVEAGAQESSSTIAAGSNGKAAAARAAAADAATTLPGLSPSAAPSGPEFQTPPALLPDAAASGGAGGDRQAAQKAAAPTVQALSDLMRAVSPAAPAAATVEQAIAAPVGSAGWGAAVAAQVHWLAGSGVTSATLHLSPEHLGPVQVFIDLQSSQVNVSFSAAHADTRLALEQALPKLREMFAAGGLALGQASVQQESRQAAQSALPTRVTQVTDGAAARPLPAVQALGLVDEYA